MHNHERVTVTPRRVKKGEKMEVRYRGLLSENGADRVWCHYGYDGWKNKATVPMENLPDGSFSCKIPANCQREINFCFKDSADHWDDNNGWNWNCEIGRGLFF